MHSRNRVAFFITLVAGFLTISASAALSNPPVYEIIAGTSRPVRPLRELEQEAVWNAMSRLNRHRGRVATALGISRSTLYLKLKELGFD